MLLRVAAAERAPAQAALLAPGIALVALEGPLKPGPLLRTVSGQRPIAPPYGTVEIGTDDAPARLAAFRIPAHVDASAAPLMLRQNGTHVALDLGALDLNGLAADPLAMIAHLDIMARRRVLDFFLSFCGPAFRLGRSTSFAQLCMKLALDCAETNAAAERIAQVLPGYVLVGSVRISANTPLVVVGQDRVTPNRLRTLGGTDGLQVIPDLGAPHLIVATGPALAVWRLESDAPVPHVLALPDAGVVRGSTARLACRRALEGQRSAQARALLRDLDLLFPVQPVRLADPAQPLAAEIEIAIPDGAGGLFVSGWIRDPLDRVDGLALETPMGRIPVTPDILGQVRRPDIDAQFVATAHGGAPTRGFVLHAPSVAGSECLQPQLLLRLRSGADIRLTPPARSLSPAAARDVVLGCVAPGTLTPDAMRRCIAPAAARLHSLAMTRRGTPDVVQILKAAGNPPVSIIIPLYRNLSFLRLQMAALAEDPVCRVSDIIFVLDSPEQTREVEHLLRGLAKLTDLPFTLVVMPRNLGYAAACNAGASVATAPILLLLNSDVIPVAPGWLSALMAPLQRISVGASGPKLLFDDDSIQHAGLCFERDDEGLWFNRHFHKGMPRHWPGAATQRAVPGVTGGALLVRQTLFEQVGGVCEDYIIGDYEDSDFCLRLRTAGAGIVYTPDAELYHFERRSISLHQGYTRTHAALYNRLLHHDRWDVVMAEAMTSKTFLTRKRAA